MALYRTHTRLPQARERERETKERLALLEEQLSVKETALGLMEEDLEKVRENAHVDHIGGLVAAAVVCAVELLVQMVYLSLYCSGGP